jgi:hypothetical protein
MTTYYINGASATEDGLTPATGYHNFSNMWDVLQINYWISQGVDVLQDGDIIECVQGDMAVETETYLYFYTNGAYPPAPSSTITIRSLESNTGRPAFHMPNQFLFCQGGIKIIGIDFYGSPGSQIYSFGGQDLDVFSIDKCRFFDVAIIATPGGGS